MVVVVVVDIRLQLLLRPYGKKLFRVAFRQSLSPRLPQDLPRQKKDYKEIIKKNRIFMKEFSENKKEMI